MGDEFSESEVPTRPLGPRPVLGGERARSSHPHLMLVSEPKPCARGLAWARRKPDLEFEGSRLQLMLRLERLNVG